MAVTYLKKKNILSFKLNEYASKHFPIGSHLFRFCTLFTVTVLYCFKTRKKKQ